MTLTFDQKYQAIVDRDTAYEGIFFTAVKTTGIFCRPSCRARKPRAENVEFFDTARDAIVHGYRPCLVCRPLESLGTIPNPIKALLDRIDKDPFTKVRDQDLREMRLEPAQVRRWFRQHHDLTFHAYQRMLRINTSLKGLANGKTVTDTAFDNGFESLSGFNERFVKIVGKVPSRAKDTAVINIRRLASPIGPLLAGATARGICLLEFSDRRMLETELEDLKHRLKAVLLPGNNEHLEQLAHELGEYFTGRRRSFQVTLDTPGTEFQQRVWRALQDIPAGETRSYQQQANALGCPGAVRAVARANGANRVAIVIPCHRVIGKDGSLTGYGGGLPRKQWLLDLEKRPSP